MTIPTASNYPTELDTDTNLFAVHDALRMTLATDYTPGDTSILVQGDELVMAKFPSTGFITITDQCNDVDERAISFYYGSRTSSSFDDLEILPGFQDVAKPKDFTHITLNVMAQHHNHLKDALIAIEEFVGVKGTFDTAPFGATLEGRINFLRKLVFTPRAWFRIMGNPIGLVPLTAVFQDESFRLGPGTIIYLWDFGDSTTSTISTASAISTSTISTTSVLSCIGTAECCWGVSSCKVISKIYTRPGKFNVALTVSNMYGQDTVVFSNIINARIEAPDEAVINFVPQTTQTVTSGEPTGGPFTIPPTIRSSVDTFIDVEIPTGVNPATGRTYGGETVTSTGTPIDPIITYTWSFDDDLTHENQSSTRAMYSVGGLYDLKLRADTTYGSYRITTYKDSIDIVESKNLWLWTFDALTASEDYMSVSGDVNANEFGLISETFKTASNQLTVYRDDSFLESDLWLEIEDTSLGYDTIANAKKEFNRNVGFSARSTIASGDAGTCLLFYAGGGTKNSSLADQIINVVEYNGFADTYDLSPLAITRPWNWAYLGGLDTSYFILGQNTTALPTTNPSYQIKTAYSLTSLTSSNTNLTMDSYKNGANELMQHVSVYDPDSGYPLNGWYATYRSTWKNSTGYFLRNDGAGTFFRIKSFYKTEGTATVDFVDIKKLPDMEGSTKLEGQLVALTNGVFFFNNSGSISAYNDTTGIWETGGPSSDSVVFNSIQDNTVAGFNNSQNTLLASSDGDYTAYLSFDYSANAFIKFNAQDLTFNIIRARPTGSQFAMGVY